jgi:hypothetical protein
LKLLLLLLLLLRMPNLLPLSASNARQLSMIPAAV